MCNDKENPAFLIGACSDCNYKSVYGPDSFEVDGSTSMNMTHYCRRCGKKAIEYLDRGFHTYQDALEDIYGVFYVNGVRKQYGTGDER